ncbi:MAG: hypothetical protein ACR2L1_01780 [Pyrinomonadaceae bacterium]
MANTDSEKKNSQNEEGEKIVLLEWAAAIIGLILVAGSLGVLLYDAATEKDTPPVLTVKTESVTAIKDGYLIKFTLYNDGTENAADVNVEGTISDGEKDSETSSVTIDYSPAHSKREGGLLFKENPQQSGFQIRATGYNKP